MDEVYDLCFSLAERIGAPMVTIPALLRRTSLPAVQLLETVQLWVQLGAMKMQESSEDVVLLRT